MQNGMSKYGIVEILNRNTEWNELKYWIHFKRAYKFCSKSIIDQTNEKICDELFIFCKEDYEYKNI